MTAFRQFILVGAKEQVFFDPKKLFFHTTKPKQSRKADHKGLVGGPSGEPSSLQMTIVLRELVARDTVARAIEGQ